MVLISLFTVPKCWDWSANPGSGKSTTGRAIAGLQKVSGGSLNVLGVEMNGVKERQFKPKRADIGFVFQDPGSSFNPLMTIAENVGRTADRA